MAKVWRIDLMLCMESGSQTEIRLHISRVLFIQLHISRPNNSCFAPSAPGPRFPPCVFFVSKYTYQNVLTCVKPHCLHREYIIMQGASSSVPITSRRFFPLSIRKQKIIIHVHFRPFNLPRYLGRQTNRNPPNETLRPSVRPPESRLTPPPPTDPFSSTPHTTYSVHCPQS